MTPTKDTKNKLGNCTENNQGGEKPLVVLLGGFEMLLEQHILENIAQIELYPIYSATQISQKVFDKATAIILKSPLACPSEVIGMFKTLRIIVGIGEVGNVNIEKASQMGIAVSHIPSYHNDEEVDLIIHLIMSLFRNTVYLVNMIKEAPSEVVNNTLVRTRGSKLGLIGCGKILSLVAERATALGFIVMCVDTSRSQLDMTSPSVKNVIEKSDCLVFTCPLNKNYVHLINEYSISQMKQGVKIVNTSGLWLIDVESLIVGLKSKKVESVAVTYKDDEALDIFQGPLKNIRNVLIIPHYADLRQLAASEVAQYLRDPVVSHLQYCVNSVSLHMTELSLQTAVIMHITEPSIVVMPKTTVILGGFVSCQPYVEAFTNLKYDSDGKVKLTGTQKLTLNNLITSHKTLTAIFLRKPTVLLPGRSMLHIDSDLYLTDDFECQNAVVCSKCGLWSFGKIQTQLMVVYHSRVFHKDNTDRLNIIRRFCANKIGKKECGRKFFILHNFIHGPAPTLVCSVCQQKEGCKNSFLFPRNSQEIISYFDERKVVIFSPLFIDGFKTYGAYWSPKSSENEETEVMSLSASKRATNK